MEELSTVDRVLCNRKLLFESCFDLVNDIKNLKSAPVLDAVNLISSLAVPEDQADEFTNKLLERKCKMEVADVVGILSKQLNQTYADQDTTKQAQDLQEEEYLAAVAALDDFFLTAEIENEVENTSLNYTSNDARNMHNSELSPHRRHPHLGECDYAAMEKLAPKWNQWTGNLPVSADMQKLISSRSSSVLLPGEILKVPFKSSAWVRANKNKVSTVDNSHRMVTTETIETFNGTHLSNLSDSLSEVGLKEKEVDLQAAAHFTPSAYGQVRYEPKAFSQHWHDLTLTECLMASPFFQQLSSEKFSALEHFAVLRSFKNGDIVMSKEQKFYDVFFIRHGAVTVGQPTSDDASEPLAIMQVLQSGDFFGFECMSTDPKQCASRYTYQALGEHVQCYAIPVEYFVDICLKFPLTTKTAPVHVNALLESAPCAFVDAAQRSLSKYALIQQETHRVLDSMRPAHTDSTDEAAIVEQTTQHAIAEKTAMSLQILDRLLNPEFDFAEVIDEFLAASKELLRVDRAGLYLIDPNGESMRYFGLPSMLSRQASNLTQQAVASISVGEGVEFPLTGVIEHVVNYAQDFHAANFSTSEFFDPSVEKRTCMGKRVKQLLLTPVLDAVGRVIAVLQFTNTHQRDAFSEQDVALAGAIASRASLIKRIVPDGPEVVPIGTIATTECLSLRLSHILTLKTNRHLRGSIRLYVGSQPLGPAVVTALVATYPVANGLRRCDFKQDIAIRSLALCNLPLTTKIVFSFESSNHHPIVWCGMYLFDYLRQLREGSVEVTMWDGAVPTDVPSLLEGLFAPNGIETESFGGKNDIISSPCLLSSGSVLHLRFPDRFTPVVHKSVSAVKHYRTMGMHDPHALNPLPAGFSPTPVPLPSGASATEWYARQMTTSELGIYQALDKIVDVIDPSDIDAETSRLVWRMRNALCVECPWALVWFLLCCDWTNKTKVEEAHRLMYSWGSVTPLMALQLLDGRFRDPKVRSYATNLVDNFSEEEFRDCLYQLVINLRFETHADSALARLLLRRALAQPNTTGKQLLWHLYGQFVASPVACANHQRLLKVYLRSLPEETLAHQGHGLYAMQRIDSIYQGLAASNLLSAKSPHMSTTAEAEQAVNLLLSELNQNPWPSEFTLPTPLLGGFTDGVVHCKKLPSMPHTFVFTLKHPAQPHSRVLYSQSIGVRVEMVYQQLLRTLDLVWRQEGVNIPALSYDAFAIGGTKSIVQEIVSHAKPLIALLTQNDRSNSISTNNTDRTGTGANFKGMSARNIPDDLVLKYFASQHTAYNTTDTSEGNESPHSGANSPQGASNNNNLAARSQFIGALAAFFVSEQVLQLREVNFFNTVLTAQGGIFVQNPKSVLGMGAETLFSDTAGRSSKNLNKSSHSNTCFFPKCFEAALGDPNAPSYKEFVTIVSAAFLSLRKHICFLICSLRSICTELKFSAEQISESTDLLKERLLLKFNDDAALGHLKDILKRSGSLDYSLALPN